MSSFTVKTSVDPRPQGFTVLVEINKSGDVNEIYTEKDNGWAGQPSVIYRAQIDPEAGDRAVHRLSIAGHGGRLADAPAIHPDLSGLDTALEQVSEITVSFP
jgi:hypothetical protein